MLSIFKKIWGFAESEKGNVKKSIALSFLFAVFHMFQIGAIFFTITALVEESKDVSYIWIVFLMMVISIVGRIVCNYFSQLQQTHVGYFMVGNKRVFIGNRLKSIPMGYFNNNSLGEITGITTTVLDTVENTAAGIMVNILSGFINSIVFTLYPFIFDWRIGIIITIGTILYLLIISSMEKKSRSIAPKRQESEVLLVESVLETIKGMFIVKSFNLAQRDDKRVDKAIEYNRNKNYDLEKLFTPYKILQDFVLKGFSVLIILASIIFYFNGTLSLVYSLMMIVISFIIFGQIETAGSNMAILRVVGSAIEHANTIYETPIMDEKGCDISVERHDIVLENVSFSYGKRKILDNINLNIPDKSSLAIVGPSGSGKSTLCNLIARFWDVSEGSIKIGGHDIREYSLKSLMNNISMVFQDVYLFNDTIENNIKFGSPDATHEMVVKASEKANCREFIESLPNGYSTVIGEGGSSLSGGEKQRISIARAILKDSPIIIFDEATANVDPENEDKLQMAMEELMKNKTIIMIAHRLNTVKNASQIIVLNEGGIVQQGTHYKLIKENGIYKKFVGQRKESSKWKI